MKNIINLYVTSYNSMIDVIKTYRGLGYNLITLTHTMAEMENGPDFIIISQYNRRDSK